MPIFTIDGNIGCGKSTLLEYLHTHYLLPIDLEPIKKWQPYLSDMYYNNKGAFEFQVRVWLDRCWIQPKKDTTLLMERSPYFQQNVFIPINHTNERLTTREVDSLNEMYNKSNKIWNPAGYIYLRSNPSKCIERIKQRGRNSEEAIGEAYIEHLHNCHEKAYFSAAVNHYPMICVDIENKTIPDIAREIILILETMGVNFKNGIYNSFIPIPKVIINHGANSMYPQNEFHESQMSNNVDNINYKTKPFETKTLVDKLRESSKAAHNRKKQGWSSNPIYDKSDKGDKDNINELLPLDILSDIPCEIVCQNYSNYRILKRPQNPIAKIETYESRSNSPIYKELYSDEPEYDSLDDAYEKQLRAANTYHYQEAFTDGSADGSTVDDDAFFDH